MNQRRLDRGQVMASLVSGVLIVVVVAAGSLALWLERAHLPEQVATHWGFGGRPDGFQPLSHLYLLNAAVGAAMPLLLVGFGLLIKQGRILSPIGAATAVFMVAAIDGSTWAQRGMTAGQVSQAQQPNLPIVVSLVAAIVVGAGLALAFRRRPGAADVGVEVDANAPRLLVDDSVRLAWTGRTRVSRAVWILFGVICLATLVPAGIMLASGTWGPAVIMVGSAVLVGVLGLAMSATVVVDARGVRARALGIIPWVSVPLSAIAGATVTTVNPLGDFGGWGLRIGLNGDQGLVTSAGPAIRIDRGDQGSLVITLTDAEAAAATLNTLVVRRAEAARHA